MERRVTADCCVMDESRPPSGNAVGIEKIDYYINIESVQEIDDPVQRLERLMKAATSYFQAEWMGTVDVDFEARIMKPYFWCDAVKGAMAETPFKERPFSDEMFRWIQAFRENKAVYVLNADAIQDIFEEEYQFYKELGVTSIIAVPFRHHTNGFIVIKNSHVHMGESGTLMTLANLILSEVSEKKSREVTTVDFKPCYRDYLKTERDVFIKLFGKPMIETLNGYVTCEQLHKAKYDLIKLLVCSSYPLNSQEIMDQIEPNNAPRGSEGIRQLVYRTRQATGHLFPEGVNLIETLPNGYRLNAYLNVITDLSCFKKYTKWAREENDPDKKTVYLQKAIDLYRGDIFVSDDCGDKIGMALSAHYCRIYQNIIEEFCSIKYEQMDYDAVHRVAAEALCRGQNDSDIYFWVIMSLYALKRTSSAEQHLNLACQNLDKESGEWLRARLKNELRADA